MRPIYAKKLDAYESALRDSIMELRKFRNVYIYKEEMLNDLKDEFDDLIIRKGEFYWLVMRKER